MHCEHHFIAHGAFVEGRIRRHVDTLVLGKESIADLRQSVWLELCRHGAAFDYRGEAELLGWLDHVVVSKVVDLYRYYTARRRDVRREAPLPSCIDSATTVPAQDMIRAEDRARVGRAIRQLPDAQQLVVRLFWFERLPHVEIARRLGRRVPATRKLLSRAKARLLALLG